MVNCTGPEDDQTWKDYCKQNPGCSGCDSQGKVATPLDTPGELHNPGSPVPLALFPFKKLKSWTKNELVPRSLKICLSLEFS